MRSRILAALASNMILLGLLALGFGLNPHAPYLLP
jgi:hypothetical protein